MTLLETRSTSRRRSLTRFKAMPTRRGQAAGADLASGIPVAQVKAGRQQFGNPAREAHGSAGSSRLHLVAAPQHRVYGDSRIVLPG
jgi:hypothetical protein